MTPTRSGSNYSIQSSGSGPGHSSHKSKGQDCQPRGEAQMEDARTSTSSQGLASTFDTLIESPEADIAAIPVFRPESFPTGNNRNIPVSVQELVYGSKEAGVGTSSKSLDRYNELIYSSEEAHGPRKDRGSSEGVDTHVLQRTSPKDKSLIEKTKACFQRTRRRSWPKERRKAQWKLPKPPQETIRLNKCQKRLSKPQRAIRRARKGKRQRKSPSGTSLTHRTTEFSRKRRQP
ncbi:hypothetical protein O181_043022 [Austropuccinia psidii MF-1]|uniref:Uncharacterized protein n=1 Tax=Austropuccinia psidii MF-1 TaxID=1389203 RepID=A0A9Q3HGE3_9BASI|nr:hypothetical protein [Austropuccinia psidii MF-1]